MSFSRAALIGLLLLPGTAGAVTPSSFPLTAPLTGELQPGAPAGVVLPPALLAACAGDLSDLRLFDQQGEETPFVLYPQTVPADAETTTFSFRVTGFSTTDEGDSYIIEDPDPGQTIHGVEVITPSHDFSRTVRVFVPGQGGWREIASDAIFDFSSQVALRKTSITLPPTTAPRLRLLMRDTGAGGKDEASLEVRFRGVELTWREGKAYPPTNGTFRLTGAMGRERVSRSRRPVEDTVTLPLGPVELDTEGNTVIPLGEVNLPLSTLTLKVETPYFYRQVEVWEAPPGSDRGPNGGVVWRRVSGDAIYRVPGMERGRVTLPLPGMRLARTRLVVQNGDNPPLAVGTVEGTVPRKWLWFLPQAGKSYSLGFGGEEARPPRYETGKLIPNDPARLERHPLLEVGTVGKNPEYRPGSSPRAGNRERTLLFAVLAVLSLGLLGWLIALLRKLPGRRTGRSP